MNALGATVFILGLGVIAAAWIYVRRADERERSRPILRTPLEWERLTGVQVIDYAEWHREHIALDEPITLAEFDRLAKASASAHRPNLHPLSP